MLPHLQGIFKHLQSFKEDARPSTSPIADLQQADPLNIVNAALARQQAAIQAGCKGDSTCADPTNLVHTLYHRHQHLLQQQPQQLPHDGHTTHIAEAAAQAGAQAAGTADDCGDAQGNAEGHVTQAGCVFDSPQSFQGDTVPDTPVAQTAADLASDQSADTAAGKLAATAAVDTGTDRADAAETDKLSSSKTGAVQSAQVQAANIVAHQHAAEQDAKAPYAEGSLAQLLEDPSDMGHVLLAGALAGSAGTANHHQVRTYSE